MNQSGRFTETGERYGEFYGLKPLKYYMNPDEMEPTIAQLELFFKSTMRKIHNRYEDKKEMEKDREKWKDIFEELIELPIDNSVYICYRKLREEARKSKFELLVDTVKEVVLTRKRSKVNPNSIRDIKQGQLESVEGYNKRFYKALKESEIELDKEITGILSSNDPSPRKNQKYLRSELFYIYKQGLQEKIRSKFPALQANNMCLDNAMNLAIGIEIENNRLNDCGQRTNTKLKLHVNQIVTKGNQNRKSEENNKICYNCGKRGHYKRHCRKPMTVCEYCKEKGHLIKFCFNKSKNNNNKRIGRGMMKEFVTITTLICLMLLIAPVSSWETKFVADIFKVTNAKVGCHIVR